MTSSDFRIKCIQGSLWGLVAVASALFATNLLYGPLTWKLITAYFSDVPFSLGVRVDSLSTLLFLMVSLLGASIGHYAKRYLSGEGRQQFFYEHLIGIVVAVSCFVLSNNLVMLFVSWLATNFFLHRLLGYYEDRPLAMVAKRKKILITRIGDLCLFGMIVVAYSSFGSLEFEDIFSKASLVSAATVPTSYAISAVFVVIAAFAMSAQYPLHFWLPDTMETPTPVSAVMHAGVINAGGFLAIRFSPLIQNSSTAHMLLLVFGAFTAVFGALCMVTQNNIKRKLAYSTIAQMGMMIFACGLGAFSVALFHIFAHSFYKAYAFLSAGSLVDESKKVGLKPTNTGDLYNLLVVVAGFGILFAGLQVQSGELFAMFVYGAVLFLGLAQNIGASHGVKYSRLKSFVQISLGMLLAIFAYILSETAMTEFLFDQVPGTISSRELSGFEVGVTFFAFSLFAAGFWLNSKLMNPKQPWLKKVYFYLWNGGYFDLKSSRMISRYVSEKSL